MIFIFLSSRESDTDMKCIGEKPRRLRHQISQILERDFIQEWVYTRQQIISQKFTNLPFKVDEQRWDEVLCGFVDNSAQIAAPQDALNV